MEYRGVKRADQFMDAGTLSQFAVCPYAWYHSFVFGPHSVDIPLKLMPGYDDARLRAESIALEKGWTIAK